MVAATWVAVAVAAVAWVAVAAVAWAVAWVGTAVE
jgi:hypothetical protein